MKFISLALIFCLLIKFCNGQDSKNEPLNYSLFVRQFIQDFNSENYKNMVGYASPSFLKSVPEKKLSDFLKDIKNNSGFIKLMRFKYFDARQSAVYHTELDQSLMNFIIGLDSNNHLRRLVVLDPNYNEELPLIKNKTRMQLPFDSTWYVFWGGETTDQNYHVTVRSQKNAFDFVIRDTTNKPFRTDGKKNEDYFCFGRKIYSPCKGEVIAVVDSVHDNIPGVMNSDQLTGNTVIIKSNENEYILMAHLKMNSILVKKGDKVKPGELIGLCGNSGNSSEPHLHLHIMNAPTLKEGTGIKCYFTRLLVNGSLKKNYSPVKGERISH